MIGGLRGIIGWCEKQDKVIAYYDDYEPAWREILDRLKELEKEITCEMYERDVCDNAYDEGCRHAYREVLGPEIK